MKKIGCIIILLSLGFINYSCDNTINPNAPFRQRYVLNGVMRSDSSLQVVTLTQSYRPPSLDPYSYTKDPSVTGAQVNLWYRDTLYEMRDTTISRTDSSHYIYPVHFYYVKNLKPASNEYVDIEALLPSGVLLQSATLLPDASLSGFFDYENDKVIPPDNKDFIFIKWKPLENILYSPRIEIVYFQDGNPGEHRKQVPLTYQNENGI